METVAVRGGEFYEEALALLEDVSRILERRLRWRAYWSTSALEVR